MNKVITFIVSMILPLLLMAGTNNVSYEELYNLRVANFTWNNGNISGTNDLSCVCTSKPIAGVVERISFVSCMGSNATFAVTLKDTDGADILTGWGTAMPTQGQGSAYTFCPGYAESAFAVTTNIHPWAFCSRLVLTVTNMARATALITGGMKLYYHE